MAFRQYSRNEYGTHVAEMTCDMCERDFAMLIGKDFTETGDELDRKWGGCCLAVECPSYDVKRDIDAVWEGVTHFIHADKRMEAQPS